MVKNSHQRHDGAAEHENGAQLWLKVSGGNAGSLSEACHGQPSALKLLCAEAFASGTARIPSAVLLARLPEVLALVEKRERTVYGSDDTIVKHTRECYDLFVAMCMVEESKTGEPVLITADH